MSAFSEEIADLVRRGILDDVLRANTLTNGQIFWVLEDSDTDFNLIQQRYPGNVFTTLAAAYAAMTTNRNDICFLSANSGHAVAAKITISKNRCHFIGLSAGCDRRFGLRSRITMGVTAVATDTAIIENTGVGNSFRNLKFDSGNTLTQGIYAFAEGGEYTYFENCEFYKSTHLNSNTAAELLMNGDSSHFKRCLFGSLVNTTVGAVLRPAVVLTREQITGKVCRDGVFEDCWFWTKAANAAQRLVYSAGATDVERSLTFKDCIFVAAKLGAASPGEVIGGASAQTQGQIILKDCMAANISKWSTLTGVVGNMPTADASMDTVAVQAA